MVEQEAGSFNHEMLKSGIILRHLHGWGHKDCIRITVGTEEENNFYIGVRLQYTMVGTNYGGAYDYDDEDIVIAAIETLGEIGDKRAVEPLIEALGDENDVVREAAKEALKKLGHEVE